ncbi:C40 family peptidase [Desertimonas flava]|uniref:C40 family peptidase n=1 Tax=Desertimonas flava TaxID=2064846 RepID=UPI0013C3FBE2|nr:NlpC/P60 family protein [Desertimonas flava]
MLLGPDGLSQARGIAFNMQITDRHTGRPGSQRTRRSARIALVALAAAAGSAFALGGGSASAAPLPSEVPGDPHSPVVAQHALDTLTALARYQRSDDAADLAAYRDGLAATAAATATEIGLNHRAMQLAWHSADRPHQVALLTALTQLGVEYRSMTSEPGVGFDCSGLTSYAWGEAGFELNRRSGDQIAAADERTRDTVMAGDLVEYPGHVMMSLGLGNAVVHSSNPESDVELWVLSDGRADSVRYGDPTA